MSFVAFDINEWAGERPSHAIPLHPVTIDDAEFLYELLASRPAEANINHHAIPSFEQHCAFIASKPYAAWYIIEHDNEPAGSVYLTDKHEIGIFIKRKYQRKGLATKAIKELIRRHPGCPRYLANIAPTNEPSLALFRRIGFKSKQITLELQN